MEMNARTVPSSILYDRGEMGKRKLSLVCSIYHNRDIFVWVFKVHLPGILLSFFCDEAVAGKTLIFQLLC